MQAHSFDWLQNDFVAILQEAEPQVLRGGRCYPKAEGRRYGEVLQRREHEALRIFRLGGRDPDLGRGLTTARWSVDCGLCDSPLALTAGFFLLGFLLFLWRLLVAEKLAQEGLDLWHRLPHLAQVVQEDPVTSLRGGGDSGGHLVQITMVEPPVMEWALCLEGSAHARELLIGVDVRTEEQQVRGLVVGALDDLAVVEGAAARVGPVQEDFYKALDLLDDLVWPEDSDDAEAQNVAHEPALGPVRLLFGFLLHTADLELAVLGEATDDLPAHELVLFDVIPTPEEHVLVLVTSLVEGWAFDGSTCFLAAWPSASVLVR